MQKQQAVQAQRLALRQHGHGHSHSHGEHAHVVAYGFTHGARREHQARRRATCTVRVNNLHAAEAIETDVWLSGELLHALKTRSPLIILTSI